MFLEQLQDRQFQIDVVLLKPPDQSFDNQFAEAFQIGKCFVLLEWMSFMGAIEPQHVLNFIEFGHGDI